MNALSKAIEILKSQQAMAQYCNVVQATVSGWLKRGTVPAEYCADIERATNGAVTRQDLRPDDYWRIWPDLAPPEQAPTPQVAQGQGVANA